MNTQELQELEEQTLREMRWATKWNGVKLLFGGLTLIGFLYLMYELTEAIKPMVDGWYGL